mmetsp:Transcript_61934/g.146659  ORF Transcript_61934/g.146659 Transcript_61934/m.146659 type:complete len:179 (+) Transcript_61934:1098-1634(+)
MATLTLQYSGTELRLPSTSGSVRVHHTSVAAHEWSSCTSIVVKATSNERLASTVLCSVLEHRHRETSGVFVTVDDFVLVGYTTPSVVPVTGAELVTLLTSALQPHRRTATSAMEGTSLPSTHWVSATSLVGIVGGPLFHLDSSLWAVSVSPRTTTTLSPTSTSTPVTRWQPPGCHGWE